MAQKGGPERKKPFPEKELPFSNFKPRSFDAAKRLADLGIPPQGEITPSDRIPESASPKLLGKIISEMTPEEFLVWLEGKSGAPERKESREERSEFFYPEEEAFSPPIKPIIAEKENWGLCSKPTYISKQGEDPKTEGERWLRELKEKRKKQTP